MAQHGGTQHGDTQPGDTQPGDTQHDGARPGGRAPVAPRPAPAGAPGPPSRPDPGAEAPPPEATRRKADWRRVLRRRRRLLAGPDAEVLRDQQARSLRAHAGGLLAGVPGLAGAAGSSVGPAGAASTPVAVDGEPPRGSASTGPADPPRVALFHPLPGEPPVMALALALRDRGADLLFPVHAAGPELDWVIWDGREFAPSRGRGFGAEPRGIRLGPGALATAALVLTPALAVDLSGTRLGHGGGYYDRALAQVSPGVPVATIVHPHEVLPAGALPRMPHDRPVPRALTASGLIRLDRAARGEHDGPRATGDMPPPRES